MQESQGKQEMGSEIMDALDKAQDSMSGEQSDSSENKENNSEQQGGGESESDKNSDKKPEDESQSGENSGESEDKKPTDSESDKVSDSIGKVENDTTFFIPGLGDMTIEDLIAAGVIDSEFDKMFDRELTKEEREAIANYLDSIKG